MEETLRRLDQEEVELWKELETIEINKEELNPDKVHQQILEALQKEAINSIIVALNISDLLESKPDEGSLFNEDVAELRINKESLDKRREKYIRLQMTGDEFRNGVKRIEVGALNSKGSAVHVDCYTGEEIRVGVDRYDHEHVISAKELSESYFVGLFMSEGEIREFANSEKNLKVTRDSINRSKKDKPYTVWANEKHSSDLQKTNAEYYGINKDIAKQTDQEARNELRKKVAIKAGERACSIGKKTAANVRGYAVKMAIGELLKITINELVSEFKIKCVDPLKIRIGRIAKKIKNQLSRVYKTLKESALNNFISIILDAVLNVFISTTKKLFKIIRMLLKPILNAIKVLVSPSEEYSFTDKLLAASKIIGAALVGVLGLFLDEAIYTALISIPGVAIIAPDVSPILSALILGMVSAMVLQGFDRYKKSQQLIEEKTKEGKIIYKLNRIAEQQYLIAEQHSYFNLQYAKLCFDEVNSAYVKCRTVLDDGYLNSIEKIERIESNTRNSDKYLNEIDDLLNVKKKGH